MGVHRTARRSDPDQLLVTYHAGCLDGIAAAWLAARDAGRRKTQCTFVGYDHERKEKSLSAIRAALRPGLSLLSVDHALPLAFMDELCAMPGRGVIRLRDHHQTAAALYARLPQKDGVDIRIDPARPSATGMIWEEVEKGAPRPPLIALLDRMDGSALRLAGDQDFAAAAYIDSVVPLGSVEAARPVLEALLALEFNELARRGRDLYVQQQKANAALLQTAELRVLRETPDVPGLPTVVVNAGFSAYGRGLPVALIGRMKTLGGALALAWEQTGGVTVGASLRSEGGNPDCAKIAEALAHAVPGVSGGGHPDAARAFFPSMAVFQSVLRPKG